MKIGVISELIKYLELELTKKEKFFSLIVLFIQFPNVVILILDFENFILKFINLVLIILIRMMNEKVKIKN